jgi:hypothetical protein
MGLPPLFLALTLYAAPGAAPTPPRMLQGFVGPGAEAACGAAAQIVRDQAQAAGARVIVLCVWTREA